ncbi:MAG: hypothetical protein WCH34_18875, partial [Bacteroidota bacterium]
MFTVPPLSLASRCALFIRHPAYSTILFPISNVPQVPIVPFPLNPLNTTSAHRHISILAHPPHPVKRSVSL